MCAFQREDGADEAVCILKREIRELIDAHVALMSVSFSWVGGSGKDQGIDLASSRLTLVQVVTAHPRSCFDTPARTPDAFEEAFERRKKKKTGLINRVDE